MLSDKAIMGNAIRKYGSKAQIDIAIEEMSELTKALIKHRRKGANATQKDVDAISEEIADVEIMTEQLKMIFNCSSAVYKQKTYKLRRLITRMEELK